LSQTLQRGETNPTSVVYGIDAKPPLAEAIPLGIQHVLAMLLGNITTPILVAGALAQGL